MTYFGWISGPLHSRFMWQQSITLMDFLFSQTTLSVIINVKWVDITVAFSAAWLAYIDGAIDFYGRDFGAVFEDGERSFSEIIFCYMENVTIHS